MPRACIALGRGLVRDLGTSPLPLPRNWRLGTQRVCRRQPLSTPELVTAPLSTCTAFLGGGWTESREKTDIYRQIHTGQRKTEKERDRQGGRKRERERRDREKGTERQRQKEPEQQRMDGGEKRGGRQTETETQRERGTASCEKRGKKDDRQNQRVEKAEPVQEATLQPHANQ